MKTDAQVSKSDPNLRGLKHAKDRICLVIYDFFKGEEPYTVENKETFVFFFTGLRGGK